MDAGVLNILEALRVAFGGPGGEAYLAEVGKWLGRNGVSSADLPGGKLKSFLLEQPAYATVDGAKVRFRDGAPVARQTDAPADVTGVTRHVRRDLWDAWTAAGPDAYLDLESLKIRRDGTALSEEEHLRHLRVPTWTVTEQLEHARTVLAGLSPTPQLAEFPWPAAIKALPPFAREHLERARIVHVVGCVENWLRSHRIPIYRFIHVQSPGAIREANPPAIRQDGGERLRAVLHEAIDEMTLPELESLLVPARFLIRSRA